MQSNQHAELGNFINSFFFIYYSTVSYMYTMCIACFCPKLSPPTHPTRSLSSYIIHVLSLFCFALLCLFCFVVSHLVQLVLKDPQC